MRRLVPALAAAALIGAGCGSSRQPPRAIRLAPPAPCATQPSILHGKHPRLAPARCVKPPQ